MDRIRQSTPATLSKTYYEDQVVVDPGTVTVDVTRADGTAVITGGATSGTGAAARTFTLTAAQTLLLDTLTVVWNSATKGKRRSAVDVAGDFLFDTGTLDALLQTPTNFTPTQKANARIWAEQKIEQAIGRAFVPRYRYETLDGPRLGLLDVQARPLRTLRSLELRSGTVWTAQTVTNYDLTYGGFSGYIPVGYRNIRLGYEYGEDYPPQDVSEAAALWAKVRLVQGPVDDRELQRFISDTGAVVNLSTPGANSWSGIPDVDAVIEAHRFPVIA